MTPSRMPSPSFARFFARLTGFSNALRMGQAGGAGRWGRWVGQAGRIGPKDVQARIALAVQTEVQ